MNCGYLIVFLRKQESRAAQYPVALGSYFCRSAKGNAS